MKQATLKIEAICTSEISVDFERTTCPYIPEDRTLHLNNFTLQCMQKMKLMGREEWVISTEKM
jgi:hypothetical protein